MSLLPYLTKIGTPQFRRFIVDSLPFKDIQDFKGVLDVLHRTSEEVLESKRKAIAEGDEAVAAQIGRGKDIISILSKSHAQLAYSMLSPIFKIMVFSSESKYAGLGSREDVR